MEALETTTRISLSNILVTTDFSQVSKHALPFAAALARQYDAKLIVAHAITPEPHLVCLLHQCPWKWIRLAWTPRGTLRNLLSALQGVRPAQMLLERGDCWNVISDIIQKNKIDLIVTGTRGRQGVKKLVLGSKAERFYRRANGPVLTVGPHVTPPRDTNWKLETILFPTDGSETSLKALPYALSLAEENQATLIFLQFMPMAPSEYQDRTRPALGQRCGSWCL